MNTQTRHLFFDSKVRWQYAINYPTAPHEYTVFEWYQGNALVLERLRQFATRIETEGFNAKFGGMEFRYLVYGDFKYWIMEPAGQCTLINRTYVDDSRCRTITNAIGKGMIAPRKGDCLYDLSCKVSSLGSNLEGGAND